MKSKNVYDCDRGNEKKSTFISDMINKRECYTKFCNLGIFLLDHK